MRLNTGTLTVGIFAILFGLIGAYALRAALIKEAPLPPPGPRSINVPLASNHLPAGRRLVLSDMVLVPMTQKEIDERGLPLQSLMISTDQIIHRVLRTEMKQGDAFLTTNLYPEGELPSLTEKLAPGLRAFTIPIDDANGVGGAVHNGAFVDVLFRVTARPGNPGMRIPEIPEATVTLVENVEVIAVGRHEMIRQAGGGDLDVRNNNRALSTGGPLGTLRWVTVAVTPDQANILKTAMGKGELSLDLRTGELAGTSELGAMTLEKMLGIQPVRDPETLEIYRGASRGVMQFDEHGNLWGDAYGAGGGSNWGSQATGGGLHHYGSSVYGTGSQYTNPGTVGWDLPNTILPVPGARPSGAGAPQGPMPNQGSQHYLPRGPQGPAGASLPNVNSPGYAYYSPYTGYPTAPMFTPVQVAP